MQYTFHRDFYNSVKDSIEKNTVTFLLGTRKCGKTVCLKQLSDEFKNSKYIDFKMIPVDDDKYKVFDEIIKSVKQNDNNIFLLDEVTYVPYIDTEINRLAMNLADSSNKKTKIVFTGSQSLSLETWSNRAFAGNTGKIYANFLTYPEFLRYKGISEVSAKTYQQFLFKSADFYNFNSLKDYLTACLEETIISNSNSAEYIFNNDCYLIKDDPDFLVNICYQTLFTLHNQFSAQTFPRNDKLQKSITNLFKDSCENLSSSVVSEKIQNSFISSYTAVRSYDLKALKQAFMFLRKCDLITITPIVNSFENIPNIYRDLSSDNSQINYKDELFKGYNLTINYPMFYINILKDILQEDMPKDLPKPLLGSIVECHARGLLPQGFEYHAAFQENGKEVEQEIDYVSLSENIAAEFSVSPKHNTYFDVLPDHLTRILLTKENLDKHDNLFKVPYYDFIHMLSQKDYVRSEHLRTFSFNNMYSSLVNHPID